MYGISESELIDGRGEELLALWWSFIDFSTDLIILCDLADWELCSEPMTTIDKQSTVRKYKQFCQLQLTAAARSDNSLQFSTKS